MSEGKREPIRLEEGLDIIQKGITKRKMILEGLTEQRQSSADNMKLYTTVYNMCTQEPPYDFSRELYDMYKKSFEEYMLSTVLPDLREEHGEFMLRKLVKRWANHKIMVKWMCGIFRVLDRSFIRMHSRTCLNEVGLTCFRELVYKEISVKVRDAVISLIDREREGEQIDQALLRNVLDIFVEIGMGRMDFYEIDFEAAMLRDTSSYYCRKASSWILEYSSPDYMLKVEECLKREKDRIAHYMHSSSEPKLLEKVQHELLPEHASQLDGNLEHASQHDRNSEHISNFTTRRVSRSEKLKAYGIKRFLGYKAASE